MAKSKKVNQWSLTLLRVVLGIIFTGHGYLKLFAEGGFTGTVAGFTSLGFPAPAYSALLAGLVEFVGGLFLLFGLVTKWSTILLFLEMLVAFFFVHAKNGLFLQNGGYEFVLLILAALVVVMTNGAGSFSLGSKFKSKFLK